MYNFVNSLLSLNCSDDVGIDRQLFVIAVSDAAGNRLGEYETQGSENVLTLRKVYRSCEEGDELAKALKLAEAKWPSRYDAHRCFKYWESHIAIAIRFAADGGRLSESGEHSASCCQRDRGSDAKNPWYKNDARGRKRWYKNDSAPNRSIHARTRKFPWKRRVESHFPKEIIGQISGWGGI